MNSCVRLDTIGTMLLERVRATIEMHRMLRNGEPTLVAVSGGLDSVVLLDVLHRLASEYQTALHVAHLDHGLRGSTSADDARFVERLAEERRLPIHASRLKPGALGAHSGLGREGAARAARYAFYESVASEIGEARIALGHTATDQAETILHRLARGTGAAGLRGIPAVRAPYIRPLIRATQDEILAYAKDRALIWREDSTNVDATFARNRLRHRVLPELEAINPRAVEAIGRASALVGELDEVGRFLVSTLWDDLLFEEGADRLTLQRDALTSCPAAVQRLVLREAVRRVRGDLLGIEYDHVESALRLISPDASHGELALPGLHIRVQSDEVLFARCAGAPTEPWAFPIDIGRTEIPEPPIGLELSIVDSGSPKTDPADRWTELADADRIVWPLELRSRRNGDRFAPFGLGERIKLKDFLISERVPYFDRGRLPLLCDREKIVWVVGVRLSDEVRVTEATQRFLLMQARECSCSSRC